MKEVQLLAGQCKKHSRAVTEADMERVAHDADIMVDICREPRGKYPNAYALAHCQVNHEDPLRFFVTIDGRVIINPKIIEKHGEKQQNLEGCYSFPHRCERKISRHMKIFASYSELRRNKKGELEVKETKRKEFVEDWARVFQHEIDHFNGKAIY